MYVYVQLLTTDRSCAAFRLLATAPVVQKWEALAAKEKAAYEQAMAEWKKKPPSAKPRYYLLIVSAQSRVAESHLSL